MKLVLEFPKISNFSKKKSKIIKSVKNGSVVRVRSNEDQNVPSRTTRTRTLPYVWPCRKRLVKTISAKKVFPSGLKIDGTSKEIVFVDGIEYDCAKYIYPILNWDSSPLVASVTLAIRHDRSLTDIFWKCQFYQLYGKQVKPGFTNYQPRRQLNFKVTGTWLLEQVT